MRWIDSYDLYLFDFDGLLVNTEEMHFNAYKKMVSERGFFLDWSFDRYCRLAHYDAVAVKGELQRQFPKLFSTEEEWTGLYKQKQSNLLQELQGGKARLMPGVARLMERLRKGGKKLAVVTHSPSIFIDLIRAQNAILDAIPTWITREQYSKPKPDPECYRKAIEMLAEPESKILGFEDTPRGVRALLGTSAEAVLVASIRYPEIEEFVSQGVRWFSSLEEVLTT